jgi:hypothetical protein
MCRRLGQERLDLLLCGDGHQFRATPERSVERSQGEDSPWEPEIKYQGFEQIPTLPSSSWHALIHAFAIQPSPQLTISYRQARCGSHSRQVSLEPTVTRRTKIQMPLHHLLHGRFECRTRNAWHGLSCFEHQRPRTMLSLLPDSAFQTASLYPQHTRLPHNYA